MQIKHKLKIFPFAIIYVFSAENDITTKLLTLKVILPRQWSINAPSLHQELKQRPVNNIVLRKDFRYINTGRRLKFLVAVLRYICYILKSIQIMFNSSSIS